MRLAETAPALLPGADMPTHSCWAFVPPHVKLEHFALFFSNSQSKSFSSSGRMPIVHLTLKIGLCCFLLRQQLVKLSCIMRTCQRDITLYKGMMWNPNCSLQLPHLSCTQIVSRFLCLVYAWHSSELGVIGGKDGVHDSLQPGKKHRAVLRSLFWGKHKEMGRLRWGTGVLGLSFFTLFSETWIL